MFCTFMCTHECLVHVYIYVLSTQEFYAGDLCDNTCMQGLCWYVFRVEVHISLHQLASSHPGPLSCLLHFLCMLVIPINIPLFKFEEFLIYLYSINLLTFPGWYYRLPHLPHNLPTLAIASPTVGYHCHYMRIYVK